MRGDEDLTHVNSEAASEVSTPAERTGSIATAAVSSASMSTTFHARRSVAQVFLEPSSLRQVLIGLVSPSRAQLGTRGPAVKHARPIPAARDHRQDASYDGADCRGRIDHTQLAQSAPIRSGRDVCEYRRSRCC